ncbi:hypothetical protein [Streptomyces sp. BF23-19]|uniref:hypothetical protein n=1 Tax=unclassified Streptomyces TaxID=2593676 RepID=UPI0034E53C29
MIVTEWPELAEVVDALSHASDRITALAEIRRILTPGGRAVIVAPPLPAVADAGR